MSFDPISFAFEHPTLGPIVLVLFVLAPIVRYRWKDGHRTLREIFINWQFRDAFFVCAVALCAYYVYRYRYWGLPEAFKKGEIGILVAEVPGDANYEKQGSYGRDVRDLLRKAPELKDVVVIRFLERPLPHDPEQEQTEAIKLGRWLHAAFVLRPHTVENGQDVWLTVVDQPAFSMSDIRLANFSTVELAEPDKLTLPGEVILLARCTLAISFYWRGSCKEAAKQFEDVLSSTDLPDVAPSRPDLTITLGNARLGAGSVDDAVGAYRKAIAMKPASLEAHYNLGIALGYKGQYDDAIAECRQALQLKPDFLDAHINLGVAFEDKGQYDAAIAEYRKALQLKPDFPWAHNNLGTALDHKGQHDDAIAEYRQAVQLKLDDPEAHYNLGLALAHKGEYDGAIAEYRQALQLKPYDSEAHINLGDALDRKGQHDDAIAEYRQAVQLKPDFVDAHYDLGTALADQGHYAAATAEYRRALQLRPDYGEAHYNLGNALLAQGHYAAAIAEFQQALRLKPDAAEVHNNLGGALVAQGQYDAAIAEFQRALQLKPDFFGARENLNSVLLKKAHPQTKKEARAPHG